MSNNCYLNPPNETKEEFLGREGKLCPKTIAWAEVPNGHVLVIWVDNGWMTSAGIIVDAEELREEREQGVMHPSERRPWKLYSVPTEKVLGASNLAIHPVFKNTDRVANQV